MRTMTLLLCLRLAGVGLAAAGLAGCAGANADRTASIGEPAAANSSAAKPKPGRAKNDSTRNNGASNANAKSDDWWKEGGVTREKVSSMCWMKYEKGRKDLPLEKRADLVNACVEQTLAAHPPLR